MEEIKEEINSFQNKNLQLRTIVIRNNVLFPGQTLNFDLGKEKSILQLMESAKLNNEDVFIVAQTSKHYWKCTYANVSKQKYDFFGDNTTRRIARRMWYIWKIDDTFW